MVHQVSQQDGVFGAWEAAGSYLTGALLDGDSLVVLVHSLQEGDDWLIDRDKDRPLVDTYGVYTVYIESICHNVFKILKWSTFFFKYTVWFHEDNEYVKVHVGLKPHFFPPMTT